MARGWIVEYQETAIKHVLVPWEDARSANKAREAVDDNGPDQYELLYEGDPQIKILGVEREEDES
ncbi:MAG: hypothetical protein IT318_20190 [Anaerolineales bacterium]|nr:hypothetical protein [Anaerolineales bacterium]